MRINSNISAKYVDLSNSTKLSFRGSGLSRPEYDSFVSGKRVTFTAKKPEVSTPGRLVNFVEDLKAKVKGNIIVVSGPSGVGKDTVIDKVLESHKDINLTVPYTTRSPRPNEKEGVDFHYITKQEFERLIKEDKIFEYTLYNDNYYGSSIEEVDNKRKGHDVILNLTADQAVEVKKRYNNRAILIFIDPPSIEELEERLRGRGTETEESIKNRLKDASYQMSFADQFDFRVVNETGKLEKAVDIVSNKINSSKCKLLRFLDGIKNFIARILGETNP